jgi:hypothetical protein
MDRKFKGYLSNQWGLSETGRILHAMVKRRIQEIGILVLDPFEECGKELDFKKLAALSDYEAKKAYWNQFSKKIAPINNKLMQQAHCLLAVLDGGHVVDDGVSAEIGYYAALVETAVIPQGRIFALRSDLRLGENIGCIINPQIEGYIYQTGGTIATNLNGWFEQIDLWHQRMTEENL